MRIGMYTKTYVPTPDGVARYVFEAKQALEKLGHEVFVFTNDFTAKGKIRVEGDIIRFPSLSFPPYPIYRMALFPFRKAVKITKKLDLDILHAHTPFMFGTMAYLAKRKTGLPLVHTFHTDFLNMRWTLKGRLLNSMFIDVGWAYSCAMYRRGDAVIAPTALMKEQLLHFKIPVPIHVVWDGIDPAHYYQPPKLDMRKKLQMPEGTPLVLFLSRLTKDKGVYTLLEAAKAVHKHNGAVFIVAGNGPESESLPRKAREEGAQGYFKVVGFVSEKEKLALYHQADVFVLPSRAETFGMVLLEAMACKTPAIGAASGGITEVIKDGKNGLLFQWGDAKELAEKIIKVVEDKELRQTLVDAGWNFVNKDASIASSAKKTVGIYEGLLRR